MPELTDHQIAHLRALKDQCVTLGAELAIIGAIEVHFLEESPHSGDIDYAVTLDLEESAELERWLAADGWVRR